MIPRKPPTCWVATSSQTFHCGTFAHSEKLATMAAWSSASVHLASTPAAATGMTFGVPDASTSIPASP